MSADNPRNTEIAIIGAGPIGIELAVALKHAGVNYIQFDAQQIGYTISWWPRETYFFSTTERIELAGIPIPNTDQGRVSGEEYLAYLRGIVEQFDLQINTYEPVVDICKQDDAFLLIEFYNLVKPVGENHSFIQRTIPVTSSHAERDTAAWSSQKLLQLKSHFKRTPLSFYKGVVSPSC